jgi:YjbE family integral membrane protein
VGPLLHSLNPALWGGMLHDGVADMSANLGHAAFWAAVLRIVFINILLSGDNAVVIAMACRDLPQRQKVWGLLIGAVVAVILRLVFTAVVGELMLRPYLKLVGGVALIYVAAKLLVRDNAAKNDVKAGAQLWRAVRIVVLADLIMSLDNVIAVAAVAQGSLTLLAIGLLASIPIIIAGAALIMAVLDRVPILVWAGAALLGWIAGDVIATDPAVSGYVSAVFGQILAPQVEIAASAAVALLVIGIGGLWRHLSATRADGAE